MSRAASADELEIAEFDAPPSPTTSGQRQTKGSSRNRLSLLLTLAATLPKRFVSGISGPAKKLILVFAALIFVSAAISLAGRWLGNTLAMGGHTDDQTIYEVVLGDNVIAAPANTIRSERARRDGVAQRLDLYMRWPDLEGYSKTFSDDFNSQAGTGRILFLSFEPRMMSRDMSGRYEPIYRSLITPPGEPGPGDTTLYDFQERSGYLNEMLAVAARPGQDPFVARCLSGEAAEQSLAECQRDVDIGDNLSLSYRFPKELLADWPAVEAAVLERARGMLRTAPPGN